MIRRRNPRFYKGEPKDILSLIFRGKIARGKYIGLFEKKFADYIGTRFAIATCSGRNGLSLLLDALNMDKGDEILMPAYTLKDLVYLIRAKGFEPKLVDIESDSLNMNHTLIEESITGKTRVILATHIFGLPCNMEKILDVARKHSLKVIEDCAHAAGAEYKNRKVGTLGDAAFFSFETAKPINTFGGGMVVTNNSGIASIVRGRIKKYPVSSRRALTKILLTYIEHLVINSPLYRLLTSLFLFEFTTRVITKFYLSLHNRVRDSYSRFTNVQALTGLKQMDGLDERNKKRNKIAQDLTAELKKEICLQRSETNTGRIFYFYVVRIPVKEKIEKIRGRILRQAIDTGIKGEITDNCSRIVNEEEKYPIVNQVYDSAMQLPMYDELRSEDIGFIANALNSICREKK